MSGDLKYRSSRQLNRTTSYTYDSLGRLTTTTYPDTTAESATFDAENHRLTSTDRAGAPQ